MGWGESLCGDLAPGLGNTLRWNRSGGGAGGNCKLNELSALITLVWYLSTHGIVGCDM